ncbi:MAG: putative Tic20 family protein [Phycisphaerales bacterium]|jgi:uncharacterized Tic20 family protein
MMPAMTSEYPVNERGRIEDPSVTNDQRTYALLMHLSILAHSIIAPLAIIITIVMWQKKKSESAFLDDHGREAVNFQISLGVYMVAIVILAIPTVGLSLLGLAVVPILSLVGMIMGMVAANRGEYFRYPMSLRFFS